MTETATTVGRRPTTYQPALDGLRAVAVAAVLLYHHQGVRGKNLGRGGFLGVDVFFVLSGFLITSLLVGEHQTTGHIAFRSFWARRARRLVPALLLMLVLVAVLARFVYPAYVQPIVHQDVWYTLTYLQNWHLALWNGTIDSPLSHTWSLSVEEQWYLVWPVAVALILAWTAGRARRVTAIILALAVASGVWTAYLYAHQGGSRAYFGTDTRAQELLIGAALAVTARSVGLTLRGRVRHIIDGTALLALSVLIGIMLEVGSSSAWYYGGFFALAIGTAIVITAAVQPSGVTRSLLALGPLVLIGRLSYGLYLFHFPVYLWLDATTTGVSGASLLLVRVSVTAALAAASFSLLEQPVRHGRFSGRRLLVIGGVVAAAVLASTTIGIPGLAPRPKSDLLAFVLHDAASKAPPDATSALVVGGARAAYLGLATKGPQHSNGMYGLAIGTPQCGLTGPGRRCTELPDDLAALAGTFRARVVILMPDEADLTGFLPSGSGAHDRKQVVERLDFMHAAIGKRKLVVLTVPCARRLAAARDAFNEILTTWARERAVRVATSPPVSCVVGGPVTPPAQTWASLAAAIR